MKLSPRFSEKISSFMLFSVGERIFASREKTSPFNHRELWVDLASIDFVGTKSIIERSIMNRDNFIKIRVSADELSAIKHRAEAANMSISSFLRNLALNGKIILYDTENIYRFNQLMRAIGTNINQIAMVVNSEKKVFKGDIDSLRREVEKISEEFHSYVSPLKSQEV